jgi:hypothetical protein
MAKAQTEIKVVFSGAIPRVSPDKPRFDLPISWRVNIPGA